MTFTKDEGSPRSFISMCFVLSYENALWSVGSIDYNVDDDNPFFARDADYVSADINITPQGDEPNGARFYGITAFETENDVDSYIELTSPEDNQFTIAAHDETKVRLISFEYLVYDPRNGLIYDQKCAELYSECNFEGFSYRLCKQVDDFANNVFEGPVRSYTVPRGKLVHLVNSDGHVQALFGINSCVETPQRATQYGDSDSEESDAELADGGEGMALAM